MSDRDLYRLWEMLNSNFKNDNSLAVSIILANYPKNICDKDFIFLMGVSFDTDYPHEEWKEKYRLVFGKAPKTSFTKYEQYKSFRLKQLKETYESSTVSK